MDIVVKNLCIVQARLTSNRLPNKVLLELGDSKLSILEHVYLRLNETKHIDQIVFAIPDSLKNVPLMEFLKIHDIPFFCGDEDDVLGRFYQCALKYNPEIIIRATCDNPFVDWHFADILIEQLRDDDYISCDAAPLGTVVEVFKFSSLVKAYKEAKQPEDREHVTPYIYNNKSIFSFNDIPYYLVLKDKYRLTVDTLADYELANIIYKNLYHGKPIENRSIYTFISENREILSINKDVKQKVLGE